MWRCVELVVAFAALAACGASEAPAQETAAAASLGILSGAHVAELPTGKVITPASSIALTADAGRTIHTNYNVFQPADVGMPVFADVRLVPSRGPPYPGRRVETPASLACIYGLTKYVLGCNPDTLTATATGGSRVVVITVAYHYPNALADLRRYSAQFGLPAPNLTVVPLNSPRVDRNWNLEAALDLQMVHAMAPNARLVLVEASSNNLGALMQAVDVARGFAERAGGGQVNGSWGSGEFSGEAAFDSHFVGNNVVYFFSSGDSASVSWPAASARVVAVGGTSVLRNSISGLYAGYEASWGQAGVGISRFVRRPAFQDPIATKVGAWRALPDIAAVANPATGVWVFLNGGWYIVGGTSVSSPLIAGMVNRAGRFRANSAAQNAAIYRKMGALGFYHDVSRGRCGPAGRYSAAAGVDSAAWDFCTGVGSPRGAAGL